VGGGTEDPEPDFAGGIATEHGAVLDEDHFEAGAGGGDRAANSGQAAADHREIAGNGEGAEFSAGGGRFFNHGFSGLMGGNRG
jgi:hypothetical protein